MPTVHRARGLRFVIFTNDHAPAHVHAVGAGGEARIELGAPGGAPRLTWVRGLTSADVRRAMGEVAAEQERMRQAWARTRTDRPLITDSAIDAARRRGARLAASEPRADAARYDAATGRVIVELTNGCIFAFPARALQGLAQASDADLAGVEVLGSGYGLHWESLDADFTVPGLLVGLFGARAWMAREQARHAGRATSPAKAAAARANGKKGGRPRRLSAKPLP